MHMKVCRRRQLIFLGKRHSLILTLAPVLALMFIKQHILSGGRSEQEILAGLCISKDLPQLTFDEDIVKRLK